MRKIFIFIFLIFSFCPHLYAQENEAKELKEEIMSLKSQFEEMKSNYENRIGQLEAKIEGLEEEVSVGEAKPIQAVSSPRGLFRQVLPKF